MKKAIKLIIIGALVLLAVVWLGRFFSPNAGNVPPSSAKQSVNADLPEQWKEYRSPSKRFAVSLPSAPQHAVESVPIPSSDEKIRYDMFLAQSRRGTVYMVNIIDYPPSVDCSDVESVFGKSLSEIVAGNPANKIFKTERTTLFDCPAMDFVIVNPEATMYGRSLLKGNSLFILSVADNDPQKAKEAFQTLADSFRMTDKV